MNLGLAGRVALVSGASKGIGLACAAMLAGEGAQVIMVARGAANLDVAVDLVNRDGAKRAVGVCADMTDPVHIGETISTVHQRFGRLDVAIGNVLTRHDRVARFDDLEGAHFESEFRERFLSAWALAKAVCTGMRERGFGRIINIASINARQPVLNPAPHYLANVVRPVVADYHGALAADLRGSGVTVNNILLGAVGTERTKNAFVDHAGSSGVSYDTLINTLNATMPMRRLGTPAEVAAAVTYLCSVQAAHVTGQWLAVDGGWGQFF